MKHAILPLSLIVILAIIRWQYGVLLFHTLAELFSVMVGVLMLVIVWNTRRFTRNDFLLYLGIGYFWIAVLDIWHTFTIEGMPFFAIGGAEITLHFWIYARFIEALLLLSAPLFLRSHLDGRWILLGGGLLTALISWVSVSLPVPVMLTAEGLTGFKIAVEYLIIALLGLAMFLYIRHPNWLTPVVRRLLVASIALKILAELSFTLYTDFNASPFMVGHLFKFLSFWLIYQAIIQTTLVEPFSLLARGSSTYDAIPHATVVVDHQGIVAQVNRAAEALVGRSAAEIVHRHVHPLFHSPDLLRQDCPLCRALQQGESISAQELFFPASLRWFLSSQVPIRVGDDTSGVVQSLTDITERRHAEQALKTQERWLSQVLNTLPYGVQENGLDGVITYSNPAHHRILGLPAGSLIGRHIWDFQPDDGDKQWSKQYLNTLIDKRPPPQAFITDNITADGRRVVIEVVWDYKYDLDGKLLGFISVISDITTRRKAEEKLLLLTRQSAHSEAKFRAITNQSSEGITVADDDGNYVFVNPAFCRMIGYSEQELLQMTVFDVKAPEQDGSAFARSKGSEQGQLLQVSLQRKDGAIFTAEVIGKMIEFDGRRRVLGTVRDITEKAKADEMIRTLSLAIEQSPVSVVITNTEARIEYVNSAFEKVTGYRADEVIGRNPRLLQSKHTPLVTYQALWEALAAGRTWEGELQNRRKNGELFWEYAHFAPVIDDSGVTRHYLAVKEDISLRKKQEREIQRQAHFDTLTSLPNRLLCLDRLAQMLKDAGRSGELAAVLFLDLDDFKKINDSLGHETGDKLLIEAARRLRAAVRDSDTVGRLGGDEFIVLLGGLGDANEAYPIAEQLLLQFRKAFAIDGRELMLTASIGIAYFPDDGGTASELLRNADSAMYHSKALGRNTASYFTEAMNRGVSRRLALEEQLHGALARGEFTIVYQPQFAIAAGKDNRRMTGAEALLRWYNPVLGQVGPAEFIPVAEQTGLIISLGQFVLNESLRVAASWQRDYGRNIRMAINLSPRQFRDPKLAEVIAAAIAGSGVPASLLELEITEGVLMSGHSYIDTALKALNQLGVSLAMDDFGTGYSSLSYLRRYPFDILKIDQSFVRDLADDSADRELITAIVAMAHGLNLKVIAEGVETTEQLDFLEGLGCEYAQGHLFSKAVLSDALGAMLQQGGSMEKTR